MLQNKSLNYRGLFDICYNRLQDDRLELNFYEDLDVLEWWKCQTLCYGELSHITCDDLSILITIVASEFRFRFSVILLCGKQI